MDTYAKKAKYNLINARTEISNILYLLNYAISINGKGISKSKVNKLYSDINLQINNLNYYIIPAMRAKNNE